MALIYGTQSERIGLYGYQYAQSTNPSHQTPRSHPKTRKKGPNPIARNHFAENKKECSQEDTTNT